MLEYISDKEFLSQDIKVQREFKELYDHEEILYSYNGMAHFGEFFDKTEYTPLITEGQLSKYLKDNKWELYVTVTCNKNKVQYVIECYQNDRRIVVIEYNLLQGYWKTVCKIINEDK